MVMVACGLWGCFTEDDPEYDVPLRPKIESADIRLDADGTPVILAQVGMNYGTREKIGPWDPKFVNPNVQSIAFSKTGGEWVPHPFRNIQSPSFEQPSILVGDSHGNVHCLISNRDRWSLYARTGTDWRLKSTETPMEETLSLRIHRNAWNGGWGLGTIALVGDDAWQTLITDSEGVMLVSSGGGRTRLDTSTTFSSGSVFYGVSRNVMLGIEYHQERDGSGFNNLVTYSWNPDLDAPEPRKRILLDSIQGFWSSIIAKVDGEIRLYVPSKEDSVLEFTLRQDEFMRIDSLGAAEPNEDLGGSKSPASRTWQKVGPDRCAHNLIPLPREEMEGYPTLPTIRYAHHSSCESGVDTLVLPEEAGEPPYTAIGLSGMQIAPDGKILVLITIGESRFGSNLSGTIAGSAIFLATRSIAGAWSLDKVAEY